MASYQIVAWKGIPASVEARDEAETATVQASGEGLRKALAHVHATPSAATDAASTDAR